jgi:hypothetical protein
LADDGVSIPNREIVNPVGKDYSILKLRADDAPNPRAEPGEEATLTAVIGRATAGTGSGAATLTLYQKLGCDPAGTYTLPRRSFPKFDTDNDDVVDWRIQADEEHHWCFARGDSIAPEWTNPDSGTMVWKLEFQFKIQRYET